MSAKSLNLVKLTVLLTLLIVAFALPVQAAQDLYVKKPIRVYSKKSRGSRVITKLNPGERVPLSKKDYGAWYKVLVFVGGKRKAGWVRKRDTKGSKIRKSRGRKARIKQNVYRQKTGVGLQVAFAYNTQAARKFDNGDGSPVEIDEMSGAAPFFGVFADFPIGKKMNIRADLAFREDQMTGKSAISGNQKQTTELKRTYISLGALLKFYTAEEGAWWFGGGGEFASASQVSLKYANSDEVQDLDKPFFIYLMGATGYDLNIAGPIFLIPEVRLGAVVNTSPMILDFEGRLNFAYRF